MSKVTNEDWFVFGLELHAYDQPRSHSQIAKFSNTASNSNEASRERVLLAAMAPRLFRALAGMTRAYLEAPGDMKLEDNPLGDAYHEAIAVLDVVTGKPKEQPME